MDKLKKKWKLWHVLGVGASFIILQFIKPFWQISNRNEILKALPKLLTSTEGIVQIDANTYLTWNNGWQAMENTLKSKGYEVNTLFRECTFWSTNGEAKKARGKNIGKYILIWDVEA